MAATIDALKAPDSKLAREIAEHRTPRRRQRPSLSRSGVLRLFEVAVGPPYSRNRFVQSHYRRSFVRRGRYSSFYVGRSAPSSFVPQGH
jgi:hypothetical protein